MQFALQKLRNDINICLMNRYALLALSMLLCGLIYPYNIAMANDKQCEIIYGMRSEPYAPYEWQDEDGSIHGMNIDLLNALSSYMGCKYRIIMGNREELLNLLERREITMLAMSPTPDTDRFGLYIQQSIVIYRYVVNRTDDPYIDSMEDWRGKTVLMIEGSYSQSYLETLKEDYDMKFVIFNSHEEMVRMLENGLGDFFMATLPTIMNMPDHAIKINGHPIQPSIYGFVLNKKDIEMYSQMNKAMDELKESGEYFDIMQKWNRPQGTPQLYKYIMPAVLGILLIVGIILLWNKLLRINVQRKTADLNNMTQLLQILLTESLQQRDEALTASRMAALGNMAANIAHEINNPLGLIMYNVDFLRQLSQELYTFVDTHGKNERFAGFEWDEAKQEGQLAQKIIAENIKRIIDTVADLKKFSKKRDSEYKAVDLHNCVKNAIRFVSYFVKHHTDNFSYSASEVPPVMAHEQHIEQVVVNLIQNACHALTARVQAISCTLTLSQDKKYAVITITDKGCGMNEETKKRAFEAFFTTRENGTGLGLSIVGSIIKEHGGYYTVESELGKGTEIAVYLPIYE